MKKVNSNLKGQFLAIFGFLIVTNIILSKAPLAQESEGDRWHQKSGYIIFYFPGQSLKGDLDGKTFYANLVDDTTLYMYTVPKLSTGTGYGVGFGGKGQVIGMEMIYRRISHSGSWVSIPVKIANHRISCNLKIYIRGDLKYKFYLGGEYYIDWLSIKNGAVRAIINPRTNNIIRSVEGDENYHGHGWALSLGFEAYICRLVSTRIELGRRYGSFGSVSGEFVSSGRLYKNAGSIESLSESGWIFSLGILLAIL